MTGEDRLRVWKPEDGGEKWFCGDCGSSLFGRNPGHADPVGIRMGTFDDDPGIRPGVRQFVRGAAPVGADPRRRAAVASREPARRRLDQVFSRRPPAGAGRA